MKIKDITDKNLKSEYQCLYSSVNDIECFSANDVTRLELLGRELERRGYEIQLSTVITFQKV